ncbi:MAG: GntR family transcriptional regulator [Gemmatimonadota bacterium]|nr:GntR family transcriptional regulator [Gemmatimonadota bacterium]
MTRRNGDRGGAGDSGLARDHHVPLRRQLAAGLEAAIRDGHIGPGSPLPSTRDMATRLGVHRSTVGAAYARLRRRGCLVGGVGSRARATPRPRPLVHPSSIPDPVDELARCGVGLVLERAFRHGVERDAAIAALATATSRAAENDDGRPSRALLFEPRPGLRLVLETELARRLGVPVASIGRPPGPHACTLLVRADLEDRARRLFPAAIDIVPLHIAGGTRERGLIRRTARGGLVTLVSASQSVRRYARDLASREFGRGISFAAFDPDDSAGIVRAASVSRLVLFDEPSRSSIPPVRAPTAPIRLLPETQMLAIRRYLGAPGPCVARARSDRGLAGVRPSRPDAADPVSTRRRGT